MSQDLSYLKVLCPDQDKLSLYGDLTLRNYTSVSIDFEFCFQSKSREDCYEEDKVFQLIDAGEVSFVVQLEYFQLNMKNFSQPMQNTVKVILL